MVELKTRLVCYNDSMICFECGTPTTNPKFCNRSCAAKYNNRVSPKRRAEIKLCLECNGKLKTHQEKFCGKTCEAAHKRASSLRLWISGEWNGSDVNGQLSKTVRGYLLSEAQYSCSKCGWAIPNPVTGKPILTINHIDGNWKNNGVDNLEVLCYNCHTLTENFGSLNAGSASGRRPYAQDRMA